MQKKILLSLSIAIATFVNAQQNVGIGTSLPHANALLDINSTDKGVLIPRLTTVQMNALTSPEGLLVYNIDSSAFAYRNTTGWVFLKGNTVSSNNWNVLGNAGTIPSSHFFGTTDNQDLIFKRNNTRAGLLSTDNTSWGVDALNPITTGTFNIANGKEALFSNTSGSYNTAIGPGSLFSNTTGSGNVALGAGALYNNLNRNNQVAIGDSALFNNGRIGFPLFQGLTNTGIGSKVLFSNTTGNRNVATGYQSLFSNTTGSENTSSGFIALYNNLTGSNNTAFGSNALYTNTSGGHNTAIGIAALYSNTTGEYNTASGTNALYANTIGAWNTGTGYQALFSNIDGQLNTAGGYWALFSNNSGNRNVAMGVFALRSNNSGNQNTAIGSEAGFFSNGNRNVFLGYSAGYFETGSDKLYISNSNVGANGALIYGDFAAGKLQVNSRLGIGLYPFSSAFEIKGLNDGITDQLIRFYNNAGTAIWDVQLMPTGALNFAETGVADLRLVLKPGGNVGIGRIPVTNRLEIEGEASKASSGPWIANSDSRLKKNIQQIEGDEALKQLLGLKGITYEWNDNKTGYKRPTGIQYGFTAQNIQQIFPALVSTDHLGYLQTAYSTYDALFVEAIRALTNKTKTLEEKQNLIDSLEKRILILEELVKKLITKN